MVSFKKVCDLLRVCSLSIISSNHFNTFLVIKLQKMKTKLLQQGLFVLISPCRFRQIFLHYLMSMDKQIDYANRQAAIIYQVTSEEFPFVAACSKNLC